MKKFKTLFFRIITSFYQRISKKLIKDITPQDCQHIKNIAVFSTTALGDFMFNTPVILALAEKFPHANLFLVSSHKNKNLVENSPWFNGVIYWDQKVPSLFSLIASLRKAHIDTAIILHSKSPYDIFAATLAGASIILKDTYNPQDMMMSMLVSKYSPRDWAGHVIDRKVSLVECLGIEKKYAMEIPFEVHKPHTGDSTKYIGFQLGASKEKKQWPIAYYQALAKRLFETGPTYQIVLIGSPGEIQLADTFLAVFSPEEKKRITNNVGRSSLSELVNTIAGFTLLVTGDTGPLHLAIALRIKTVSLFVATSQFVTGPFQDPELHTVIQKDRHNSKPDNEFRDYPMAVISVDEVFDAVIANSQ